MDAKKDNSGENQGNPSGRRRRSKETPAVRRAKDRRRKRRVRAAAAGRRPPINTSSSEEELPKEIGGIPQENNAFPVNVAARKRVAEMQAAAGPSKRPHVVESVLEEGGGILAENPANCSGLSSYTASPAHSEAVEDEAGTGSNEAAGEDWGNPGGSRGTKGGENNHDAEDEDNMRGDMARREGITEGNHGETLNVPRPLWEDLSAEETFALAVQKVKGSSNVSDAAVNKLLEVVVENLDTLREFQGDHGTSLLYTRRLKPIASQFTPKVWSGVLLEVKHPHGLEYRHEKEMDSIPKEYLSAGGNLRVIREEAYVHLRDIKRHHEGVHANKGVTMETLREHYGNCALSVDGVQESHKGKKKFHVVSLRLGSCIYLYKIFNPLIGHPAADPSLGELLGPIVQEINEDKDITLKVVIADMPERHSLRAMMPLQGRYSCEFCVGKGDTGSGIMWPYPKYYGCTLRTHEEVEAFARCGFQFQDPGECNGILGFSPLLDLHSDFDIVYDVPADQFHLLFEGMCKEMFRRMFTGETTRDSLDIHRELSEIFQATKVFSETPRKTRPLVWSTLKGHEYGLITFSLTIPLALDVLEPATNGVWLYRRHALLYFTFLSRLYNYDDETLAKAEEYLARTGRTLQTIHRLFYDVFQRGFCAKTSGKVTINFHTFSHLDEVRKRTGPLWRNSTESFESMYGVMRRCYKVGTPNTSKQAMENFYLRDIGSHRCKDKEKLVLTPARPGNKKTADNYVVTPRGFRAIYRTTQDYIYCHPIELEAVNSDFLGFSLPWHLVGVFKMGDIQCGTRLKVKREAVTGKAMLCGGYLTEWRKEWLFDSKKDY